MQYQSENYERFQHENEVGGILRTNSFYTISIPFTSFQFSYAGDTDDSYNEEYSNSDESQYFSEQWVAI